MQTSAMQDKAAVLLTAARTERGERREHMLEEARLWIDLATIAADDVADVPVPDGTVIRIPTRGGALTVVREATDAGVVVYPWTCLGCGDGLEHGAPRRNDARKDATAHARGCWALPQPADDSAPQPVAVAHTDR